MMEIPAEVLHEILSRLAAPPLLRLRCVCKSWRDTIDDPIFARLHLHRQLLQTPDSSTGYGHLILRGDLDTRLYSLPLQSLHPNCPKIVKAVPLNHIPINEGTRSPVGSCNGVMLISPSKGNCLLWNPITREFHRLPSLNLASKKLRGLYLSVSGIGYDCAADDYKVVRIAQVFDPRDGNFKSETFVYSMRLDSWRRIKDFPYRISRSSGGVFLKGVLHWVSSSVALKCMNDLIIGLDLGGEDYCLLPLPGELSGQCRPSAKQLGVLGGFLILSCYYQIERLDVWMMKDYGVEDSWFKLFSVAGVDNIGAVETLRPIAYSKCKGEVLLQHDKKELLWFDLETKLTKRVRINGWPVTFSSQFCLESLVRFNVGGGGCNNAEGFVRDGRKRVD